ncbi:hypothetical protein ACIBJI_41260 [Nocardia sp. NPDC050408]|uniref:hypothetical protein n=1 Tax=Nocardia sp. NPDC050408 TaxID=3364319 RepID=UPI0037B3898F
MPLNVGMQAQRRAIRTALREREAAWRELFNSQAQADDLEARVRTIRPDFAASIFGQPFVEARTEAVNGKTAAATRAEAAQQQVEAVEAAWDSEAANDPLFPDGPGDLPIMLLPVRIETLFRPTDLGGAELSIRVYPDDIHIDAHETGLTPAERAAGVRYWRVAGDPAGTADAHAAAWADVVAAVGQSRGLWAVESLREGGNDLGAKDTTWTRPPLASLLPHHFTFSGYREGRLMWRVDGEALPEQLPAGFAPPGIEQDDNGGGARSAVPWQAGSRWLVDFDAAVAAGMAVRVPLTDTNLHYDLVTVVGIGAADPDTAAAAVQELLIAHSYTDGLSVLPAGTPTNNTPGSRSGWQSRPQLRTPDEADGARQGFAGAGLESPAARMSIALGVDLTESLAPAPGALFDSDDLATTAHQFIAGLMGDLSLDWLPLGAGLGDSSADIDFLVEYFTGAVRSRGLLPVLRIGRQPYGVLPVTPLDLWRGHDVDDRIAFVTASVLSYFKENLHRAPRVGTGQDQDAAILDLLSRRPASVRLRYADDLHLEFLKDRPYRIYPPATVGITMADMNIPFSARGPIGTAPGGFDFTAAIDPTPELLALVATRPLQAYADVVTGTQEFLAGAQPGADFPPELVEKMEAVNASASQMDPATSGLFYQLALPLFRTMWWISVFFRFPSGMPDDHPARPMALALQRSTEAALQLEALAADRLADLERALCECMDTASHRVDAWATSLATVRLMDIRSDTRTGLRTGAYGWVVDLEPSAPGKGPERDGYIVTPSLHHATTAAVLRSGCLAHSDAAAFAVNLTSARVRSANRIIEGIKQGQSLDYLLGYRFERALHDRSMDHLIPAFRARYPIAPQVDPDAAEAEAARAAVAARNVVDGLALSRDRVAFDSGQPTVPLGPELAAVRALIADLDDTFDAVGDLLLAESVHHIVGGNPLRAGLAADAASRGLLPDTFEVVSTPRSADTVSYALGALLDDHLDPGSGWNSTNGLALLEPALENWCRARLGSPGGWVFRCRRADGSISTATLSDLPIGAFETVRTIDASTTSTFARRLLAASSATEFTDDDAGSGRYAELVTLAESLRTMIATSAPLSAAHFDAVADPWAGADLAELGARVGAWSARVRRSTAGLRVAAAAAPPVSSEVAAATADLVGCGIPLPVDADLSDTEQLIRGAAQLVAAIDAKLPDQLPPPPSGPDMDSTTTIEWISKVTAPVAGLTCGGVPVLPRITLAGTGIGDLLADEHRPPEAAGDELADWIRDVGRVRPAVRSLDDTLAAAELVAGVAGAGYVVTQAPASARPPWIAVHRGGARSCAVLVVAGVPTNDRMTGLVVDSWSEVLPREGKQPGTADEVAGIAFHTARPDARAPQAILLAVPPDRNRGWHIEDVHGAVEEAFELAQVRGMDLTDLPELRGIMPPTFEGGDFTVNLPA